MVGRLGRAVRVLAVGIALGCGSRQRDPEPVAASEPEPEPPGPTETLVVEHAGCTVSTRAPATCTLRGNERALRLWIDALEQPVVELDGTVRADAPVRVGDALDGWRATIAVPAGARELTVRTGAAIWRMELRDAPAMPVLDAIEARLPDQSDPKRSAAVVTVLGELPQLVERTTGLEQVLLLRLATVLCWDLGRTDEAIAYGKRGMTAALDSGNVSTAIDLAQVLGHLVSDQPGEVSWLLELQRLYMPEGGDATRRTLWHYALAYQALETGELGVALAEAERSEALARRMSLGDHELTAAALEVSLLGLLRRESDRARVTERILELASTRGESNACNDAVALAGVAWSLLQAGSDRGARETPTRVLEQVLRYYEPGGGCAIGENPDWALVLAYAHVYQAIDSLTRRDFVELSARLTWFNGRPRADELRGWIAYLEAEVAFADARDRDALTLLGDVGPDAGDPLLSWQATVLRGRALERSGRRDEALEAYLESERLLDRVVSNVGVDQGREGLGVGMHDGASRAIALLLDAGEMVPAARVARLSRSRALRPVGRAARLVGLSSELRAQYQMELARYRDLSNTLARELTGMWRLPDDERAVLQRRHAALRDDMRAALVRAHDVLSQDSHRAEVLARPAPDEVWLLYHPSIDGWFGFALTEHGVAAKNLGAAPRLVDDAAAAMWLLEPFDAEIRSAAEIHILAMGALLDVNFEVLPRNDGPLLAERAVAYALDLGAAGSADASDRALVVGDPDDRRDSAGGKLLGAREEALAVEAGLARAGYRVELLLGDSATQHDVLAALERIDWFHHAGHGQSRGVGGWDSALPLSGEASLGVRDVLALARAPRAVVLSACETATTRVDSHAGGMHLAGAFILAGSSFVIASLGPVDDEVAARFSAALYKRSTSLRTTDGPQLLRASSLDVMATLGGRPTPFHVWVP